LTAVTAEPWYRWRGTGLELRVHAKPRSRSEGLGEVTYNGVPVRVNALPAEGEANRRLKAVLADAFGVAPSRVQLMRGARSRHKWVRIDRPARIPEALKTALQSASEVDQTLKDD